MNFWNTRKGKQLKSNASSARKDVYGKKYEELIQKLTAINNMGRLYGFIKEMHTVLTTGSRPFTEKMYQSTIKALSRPEFDTVKMIEQKAKSKGLIEKVNIVYDLVMEVDGHKATYYQETYSAIPFVRSVKDQAEKKYWLSNKQMEGLNKVYKKYLKRKEKIDESNKG